MLQDDLERVFRKVFNNPALAISDDMSARRTSSSGIRWRTST